MKSPLSFLFASLRFLQILMKLLKLLKDFYNTRSRVIHGANLQAKHQTLLRRVDELRNIVKRLLVAFIRLGNTKPAEYGKNFWQEKLDGMLVNTVEREKLRVALGVASENSIRLTRGQQR